MCKRVLGIAMIVWLAANLGGCKTAYYGAWEKLGWEKRDILVERVKDARDDQNAAKQQFQTTLERFKAVTGFEGGALEAKYKKLEGDYDSCVSRAGLVTKRIASVETVAADLFKEWKAELAQYSSDELRLASERKLRETEARYDQLIGAMKKAEAKMKPVLAKFHDQVLFLKHNLNAQAIASLQTTSAGIEAEVGQLIKEMDASIDEANTFIAQMK